MQDIIVVGARCAGAPTAMLLARDGAVYTWDTLPESWVAAACAIAGRNLTEEEWRDAFGPQRLVLPDVADPRQGVLVEQRLANGESGARGIP